jgi:hypothetical protein
MRLPNHNKMPMYWGRRYSSKLSYPPASRSGHFAREKAAPPVAIGKEVESSLDPVLTWWWEEMNLPLPRLKHSLSYWGISTFQSIIYSLDNNYRLPVENIGRNTYVTSASLTF